MQVALTTPLTTDDTPIDRLVNRGIMTLSALCCMGEIKGDMHIGAIRKPEMWVAGLVLGLSVTLFSSHTIANGLAQPLVKVGACPSGYYQSGNYCNPSSGNTRVALPKVGSCPSGYYQSGDYCLASSAQSRNAIQKAGSCPSGYFASGNHCLSAR